MRLRLPHTFLLFILLSPVFQLGARETTVVLLRHAERESLWDGDSPLSPAGQRRIQLLVPLLEAFRPTTLYTSDLARTQQTLAPLAARLGLKPLIRSKGDSATLPAEILRDHRGETLVVCWHHDLMKKLVRGLGVKGAVPYWSLDTYDWLWIVHVPDQGEASLEQRMQGLSAPAEARSPQGR
ncbi:MAG: histidine phosphatase family protein [Holophagaceae bacterium]|uniref:Histidine phosphatase family protein n=1 Tax=Candidatus Geothrix skivensis TaxID=2954439 RepID=A0A9D7SGZ3_9BACT|nr:histidine phosphatase family protein [Candidatus Geothrix skivensis]